MDAAAESDELIDEWFIESLNKYKDLHEYQLEHPTSVLEWTSAKTVCVAGCSSSQNEILELRLPLKLLAEENKSLCAERDFKVLHGGFSADPVHCLKHMPGSRCVVTHGGGSELHVWDLGGDDSDVVRRTGSIRARGAAGPGCKMAARRSSPSQLLHGGRSSEVTLTELTSGQTLYRLETDSADALGVLHFVSDAVFLAGCRGGSLYVADVRSAAAPQRWPPPPWQEAARWWTAASASPSGCRVLRLADGGRAVVSDLRHPGGGVSQAQLDVQTGAADPERVAVAWAPQLDGCISTSDSSGLVQIFSTSGWRAEPHRAQPLFQHRGHLPPSQTEGSAPVRVTAHAWHPERPRTLLSAASDGSVHVWDWVGAETT